MKDRRERRRAERKWRASKFGSDFEHFKARRNYALYEMNDSRLAYYKKYIDNNSPDQGRLFRVSKPLLNLQADKALPPHTDARVLANELGQYFVHKITAIRAELDADDRTATSGASLFLHHLLRGVTLSFQTLLHFLKRVCGELVLQAQRLAPLILYHRLF